MTGGLKSPPWPGRTDGMFGRQGHDHRERPAQDPTPPIGGTAGIAPPLVAG